MPHRHAISKCTASRFAFQIIRWHLTRNSPDILIILCCAVGQSQKEKEQVVNVIDSMNGFIRFFSLLRLSFGCISTGISAMIPFALLKWKIANFSHFYLRFACWLLVSCANSFLHIPNAVCLDVRHFIWARHFWWIYFYCRNFVCSMITISVDKKRGLFAKLYKLYSPLKLCIWLRIWQKELSSHSQWLIKMLTGENLKKNGVKMARNVSEVKMCIECVNTNGAGRKENLEMVKMRFRLEWYCHRIWCIRTTRSRMAVKFHCVFLCSSNKTRPTICIYCVYL